ncbi:Acyl-CoA reductase [Rhodovulum sp. ES.010]|uniref:aldehyde dehydrogenase family protein n=1 Tax=Rhodovulum sp. ES.010 TaxID=1882821 RepID=UPI0009278D65|nr:aldehyde dehydrogenase family protein [Rhodovulum sp. ES.010]SIO21799.1 Acyl-CoA reductase [Rhodovulum sp. ES.010]
MTESLKCISPVDGSVFAERRLMLLDEAVDAVALARAAQPAWAARRIAERAEIVRKAVALIGEANDEIVPELAWQMGRPVRYGGEFGGFQERALYMADIAEAALADIEIEQTATFARYVRRLPQGLVLVVAPWNYPYMTAINTVAPALIAGNAVMLKHASQTPLVGERIVNALREAGVPDDIVRNVFLGHDTTSKLIAAGAFDFVNFTGSVGGGKAIERAAAGTFTGLGLELGGKDPGYVMEDADLEVAADGLMDGAMFNSGQCCCGIERIYVADSVYEPFVDRCVEIVSKAKLGNPLHPETTMGPMAQTRFADLVRAQTEEAVAAGATPLIDRALFPNDDGAYLMPQILVDVDHSMRVMREESFGPVVGIMRVRDDADAIEKMNDSEFGLTASLWTRDAARAARVGDGIETGTVFMNRCDYLDPALCWTGCKNTGRGVGLSVLGYHALTRPKSYHLKKG